MRPWLNPWGDFHKTWLETHTAARVNDVFGFHALQLGHPELNLLQANRMPHRWVLAGESTEEPPQLGSWSAPHEPIVHVLSHTAQLPFEEGSLDLLVLPHTLDEAEDPHATLREVARVLRPEGRLVLLGYNPASSWGLQQRWIKWKHAMGVRPTEAEMNAPELSPIGYWRVRDWLRLLSFDIEGGRFGCYRPELRSERWFQRLAWMEKAGDRWVPVFGAVYILVAVKRVHAMRLMGPAWKTAKAKRSMAVAQKTST